MVLIVDLRVFDLRLLSFAFGALFDAHIPEFAGFEDLAALEAFHKLSVLIAAHNLHARVFAGPVL